MAPRVLRLPARWLARFSVLATLSVVGLSLAGTGCYRALDSMILHPVAADYSVESQTFQDSIESLVGAPLVDGNTVTELVNGDRIFSAMIEDIKRAQKSITLEQYIWSSGAVSDLFVPALAERARAGVKVLIIVDSLGSAKLKQADIRKLKEAGCRVAVFNPMLFARFRSAAHRTHRKLLVIDGRVGYIGGVCMSDDWRGDAEPGRWRDTQFRVEGPAAAQIQRCFAAHWVETESEAMQGEAFFPPPTPVGHMKAQCFNSGPHCAADSARADFLLSFAAARKSIVLEHAYFAPDNMICDALIKARERGVRVEVLIPKKIDNPAVMKASRQRLARLIGAGVAFYQYEPTLLHCKIAVVDGAWVIAGSVNMDTRSLRINDEAALNVLDKEFAAQVLRTYEDDKARARPLTLDDLRKRGLFTKVSDEVAGLLRSEL